MNNKIEVEHLGWKEKIQVAETVNKGDSGTEKEGSPRKVKYSK